MKIHSKITIPEAAAKTGGALKDFVWDRIVTGEHITYVSDWVVINSTNPSIQPTFAELVAIIQSGGSFEGIRLAIEFASGSAAQQNVPPEVVGASYTDEEGVEQPRTWLDWFRANSSTQIITNGIDYVAKAMFNGKLLDSVELTAIHAQAGVSVIEWADATARFQDEAYTEFEL